MTGLFCCCDLHDFTKTSVKHWQSAILPMLLHVTDSTIYKLVYATIFVFRKIKHTQNIYAKIRGSNLCCTELNMKLPMYGRMGIILTIQWHPRKFKTKRCGNTAPYMYIHQDRSTTSPQTLPYRVDWRHVYLTSSPFVDRSGAFFFFKWVIIPKELEALDLLCDLIFRVRNFTLYAILAGKQKGKRRSSNIM